MSTETGNGTFYSKDNSLAGLMESSRSWEAMDAAIGPSTRRMTWVTIGLLAASIPFADLPVSDDFVWLPVEAFIGLTGIIAGAQNLALTLMAALIAVAILTRGFRLAGIRLQRLLGATAIAGVVVGTPTAVLLVLLAVTLVGWIILLVLVTALIALLFAMLVGW